MPNINVELDDETFFKLTEMRAQMNIRNWPDFFKVIANGKFADYPATKPGGEHR